MILVQLLLIIAAAAIAVLGLRSRATYGVNAWKKLLFCAVMAQPVRYATDWIVVRWLIRGGAVTPAMSNTAQGDMIYEYKSAC